jgi:hypothetical protein
MIVWLLVLINVRSTITVKPKAEFRVFLMSRLNISLEANLAIYTNRTISPPRKIKNKI